MKRSLFGLLLLIMAMPSLAMAKAAPNVVVSLKPIHSLVAGVMAGVGEPELLVKGAASPHGYVLRPSEARLLSKADLIIRVGSGLEGFMDKPLATLGHDADKLDLAMVLKDKLLPAREGGDWEKHEHHHDHDANHDDHDEAEHHNDADHDDHHEAEHHNDADHDDHHEAEHHNDADHDHDDHDALSHFDQHIWLSPVLAKEIVKVTATQLAHLDPQHAEQYRSNSDKVLARLDKLDQQLKKELQPVSKTPYVVFHAAYQYFEVAYSLNPVGSITIDPERRPGAKRVKEIRDKIARTHAKCVFSEPQFESRLIATLIEGTQATTGILDPLGADLKAGPDAYFTLMEKMGHNLYQGLTK